ncbi:MAG: hypothetical protein ACK58N_13775 [Synechocystis sp.]
MTIFPIWEHGNTPYGSAIGLAMSKFWRSSTDEFLVSNDPVHPPLVTSRTQQTIAVTSEL